MKKKLPLVAILAFISLSLGACTKGSSLDNKTDNNTDNDNGQTTDNPSNPDNPTDPDDPNPPVDPGTPTDPNAPKVLTMQDETILHAWNWSMNNIKNSLSDIKKAGFNTVQLSPMQPQKDYYTGQGWSSQWWKLYQPLGFSVALDNQNVLGTKSELASLCSAAKSQGINIIMDVVTNHLAGPNNGSDDDKKNNLYSDVSHYEQEIYSNGLIHHTHKDAQDSDLQSIVQGHIGKYPDLMTEDTRVQNRVKSLLKEYIDCGVNGFRFDAAKHIETADDGTYASNYWPNIIGYVNDYATSQNKAKPYIYGEILYQCGNGRKYSSYTKYMSVVDKSQGDALLSAVKNKSVNSISTTYNTGVNPDHLVLWAESHDTYANDEHETTYVPDETINKAYMIQASRKDATTLYFARPSSGNIGSIGSLDYKKASITAINKFHSLYAKEGESITKNNGVFINVRGNTNKGAALINVGSDASSATVNISLDSGVYVDLITNKEYNINSNSLNVTFTDGACILVPDNGPLPSLSVAPDKTVFQGTTNVSISVSNATSAYYQINGGAQQSLSGSTSISVGNGLANGDITLKVVATNNAGSEVKEIKLLKTDLANCTLIVKNVPNLNQYSYLVWSWPNNGDGKWYGSTIDGNMMGFTFPNNNFIIVRFDSGTTPANADWNNKKAQTANQTLTNQVIDYSTLGI